MTFTCRNCGGEVAPGQGYLETQVHIDAAVCISVMRDRVERLEYELAELKHPADEPETGAPPDELWLQWYGDDEDNYLWPDDVDRPSATWCRHRVWPRDVRYVRAIDTAAERETG